MLPAQTDAAALPETPMPWGRRLRRVLRGLQQEHASPARMGVAVGVGVFLGCSPAYGFQVLLCLAAAALFKLNRLAVLIGVQISAPPTMPFLIFGSIQLGERLLRGRWLSLSLTEMNARPAKEVVLEFLSAFALGGTLVGIALALPIGWATTRFFHAQQRRAAAGDVLPPDVLEALLVRAEKLPLLERLRLGWRTRFDPVFARVVRALAGRREVVQVGPSDGALLVLLDSVVERVRGVRMLPSARVLCEGLAQVELESEVGTPDALVAIDLPEDAWSPLLATLTPGGVALLRVPSEASRPRLEAAGFQVSAEPCGKGVLLRAVRA